ncbi:MAG: winged helix-turn-helix domain-containing protein [Pseudomonadota bacterium]
MTSWTVGAFQFDANTNRLHGRGGDVALEPKASALLAYFCEHPGRNIGRDELLQAVWHGQLVSDNSINRVIVLLRKALGDDKKVREYIATVPKVGYRFIARVSAIEHSPSASAPVSPPRRTAPALLAIAIAVATVLLWSGRFPSPPAPAVRSIVPLSRLAVTQSNGAQAHDGGALLYTAHDGQYDRIYQVSRPGDVPEPISAPGGDADFASWAHDDRFIVYQFFDGERCEFHLLERAQFGTGEVQVIYECISGSYSELALSLDDRTLYFLERPTPAAPYAAYALKLEGGTKRRLSQPVARGYGNHYLDVHPTRGSLLLLSDQRPGKTSVFEVDPASDSFSLLTVFEYGLDSAIWSHRDGYIVHPSRHPSYQLLETSLTSDQSRVVVSDSRRISSARRMRSSGQDYLFTSYLYNRDIELAQGSNAGLNSAVMDYLPALSHDARRLAFISKRAGYSQIWVRELASGRLRAIEPPDEGRRFHDLRWSADHGQLLANTNTGLLVYAIAEDRADLIHDVAFELPVYAVRWRDERTVSFSHYENGRWRAYEHRLDTGQNTALDARWAFSLAQGQRELLLDQSLVAFRDGRPVLELRRCADPVWRYQLRWYSDGQDLYCHAGDSPADVLRFDAQLNSTRLPGAVNRFEFFSVARGKIASTYVASSHSDIMRTGGSE